MFTHKAFIIVTNLLGLNFYEQKVPLTWIFLLHILANVFNISLIIYVFKKYTPEKIYIFVDIIQVILPLVLKNFLMFNAFRSRNFDLKLNELMKKTYKFSSLRRNQKKFLALWTGCLVLCVLKTALVKQFTSLTYVSMLVVPSIFNPANDFLFAYHFNCLTDYLKDIRASKHHLKVEICKIFKMKQLIITRYSTSLTMSISLYFVSIIISLYWIFVRLVFNYLNDYNGETICLFTFPKFNYFSKIGQASSTFFNRAFISWRYFLLLKDCLMRFVNISIKN
jgi:hypothetical protein